MCNRCNYDSPDNQIYVDPLTNKYYLDIETSEWDEYDDGFVHQREYIAFCPWCGRKLQTNTGGDNEMQRLSLWTRRFFIKNGNV